MLMQLPWSILDDEVFFPSDLVPVRLEEGPQLLSTDSPVGVDFADVGDRSLEDVGVLARDLELVELPIELLLVEVVVLDVVEVLEVFQHRGTQDCEADAEHFAVVAVFALDLASRE